MGWYGAAQPTVLGNPWPEAPERHSAVEEPVVGDLKVRWGTPACSLVQGGP